jgi:iron(III) transport system ATP-binding protein
MFLRISHLCVQYPNRPGPSVDGVSLGLGAGEIGVLLGPSGCGKTTLLRAVAGLERVNSGEICLDQSMVSNANVHVPPERRRIGMVFQDHALFPHLSVADNVMFGLLDQPKRQRIERTQRMLELVGLAKSGGRFPHELSGGQQQRVALARALAPQPQLLLLDEPFSNLDIELRERLASDVRKILKEAKTTALVVTHDQMEAFAMGDTIGVMSQGCLHQWDDAYHLYHRPKTRFVAEFIGHGVFVPARLVQQQGRLLVQTAVGDLSDLTEGPPPGAYPDGWCDVLLRADDVVHDDDAPVKAEIILKAFRGSEFLYTLRLANGQTLLAHVPSHHDHHLGEWIGIRIQADHVVTFDRLEPASTDK